MGRKSALTDAQWEEVDRRLLADEPARVIARSFAVSESIIRVRKKTRTTDIRNAAQQLADAERALTKLPISAQRVAITFAQKLQAMSDSLAEAAMLGAQNAADLKVLARTALGKALQALQAGNVDVATKELAKVKEFGGIANDEADIAVRVVTAQKEAVRDAHRTPPADAPDLSNLDAAELDALERTLGKVGTRLPAPGAG